MTIESPLAGDFEKNRRYALWCVYHCASLGEAAYASHLFYPQCLNDEDEQHREFGIQAGYEWASKGSLYLFYQDLGWSKGMLRAKDRWEGRPMQTRSLPMEMKMSFLAGESPKATRGF